MKNKRSKIIVSSVAILLLIPLLAMQFTNEVTWTFSDFVVAAIMLLGTGFTIDFVLRKVTKIQYRIAICIAVLALLLLVWAELAVGIFDTPFAGS